MPAAFDRWNTTRNKAKKDAKMFAMWKMVKLDIKKLQAAFDDVEAGQILKPL